MTEKQIYDQSYYKKNRELILFNKAKRYQQDPKAFIAKSLAWYYNNKAILSRTENPVREDG